MKHMILMIFGAIALTACGKKDVVENSSALENISIDATPANDASALEAVEAENARSVTEEAENEAEVVDDSSANASANESENAQ